MNRLFALLVVLAILVLVVVEVMIPSRYAINGVVRVPSRAVAVFSVLRDKNRWADWWPRETPAGKGDSVSRMVRMRDSVFDYRGCAFRFQALSYNMVRVGVFASGKEDSSQLGVFPIGSQDESLLQWHCNLPMGRNPIRRIQRYLEAEKISDVMDSLLARAVDFLGKKENIYGIAIGESSTKDTLLVYEETHFIAYPSDAQVYGLIDAVKKRIAEAGAGVAGYPMVNISGGDTGYKVRVAVPTDRHISDKGAFHFMRLIPGNYLVTEVTGGPGSVASALAAMKDYIRDYQRTVMAIPFQSLVTDREAEPDTTRWKTRIYYPIF